MCESALKAASGTKDLENSINKGYKSSTIKHWCFEGFIQGVTGGMDQILGGCSLC